MKTWFRALAVVLFCTSGAAAQETDLRLAVPAALETTGLMDYIVPRFSLKTGVRMSRVAGGAPAQMRLGETGTPVFEGGGRLWHLAHDGDARAERFLDWLTSDIGQRTIESFTGPDGAVFAAPRPEQEVAREAVLDGDVAVGERVSHGKCGRCHVVSDANRMKGTGATPSFALMRSFEDWQTRFATFHLLKPHPAFTQIDGVSEGFDPARPSPIAPLRLTLDELDAILAYVAGIAPADLGAPLQLQ